MLEGALNNTWHLLYQVCMPVTYFCELDAYIKEKRSSLDHKNIFSRILKYDESDINCSYGWVIPRRNMKCPEKHVIDDFVMWCHLHFILKCPKIEKFHFWFLICFQIDHVCFNAPVVLSDSRNGKMGHFKISYIGNWDKKQWSILKQKWNRK